MGAEKLRKLLTVPHALGERQSEAPWAITRGESTRWARVSQKEQMTVRGTQQGTEGWLYEVVLQFISLRKLLRKLSSRKAYRKGLKQLLA